MLRLLRITAIPKSILNPKSYWANSILMVFAAATTRANAAPKRYHGLSLQHRVYVKLVRIFNTYGPGILPEDGRAVSNFIVQALRGLDITIYGEGQQTRSFCHVSDLIDGFQRLMALPEDFSGPVKLGNPCEYTMLELAKKVDITGSKSQLVFLLLPWDDPRQRQPDITLAKSVLDWEPKVALDEGMRKTVDYFDTLLH